MSSHSIFAATWLLGLLLLIAASEAFCQAPADSAAVSADSGRGRTDSVSTTGAFPNPSDGVRIGSDTVRAGSDSAVALDSTSPPDSSLRDSATADAGLPSDTLRPRVDTNSIKTDTLARIQAPRDSVLAVACRGPAGPRSIAQDLLVIVFAPDATAEERAAAATTVRGKLVSSPEPGALYLRVPTGGDEYRLRDAADQLALLPQVREVGSRACRTTPLDTTS
jgi:hypothetical protein